jgi:uncharacterized protein YkwD
MLKRRTSIFICLLIGVVLFLRPTTREQIRAVFSTVVTTEPVSEIGITSADIIEQTNKERVKAGFSPLATNEKLNASAALKVDDMISRQYFEHQSPTGEGVSDLGVTVGYQYVIMGENLALGSFDTSVDIVQAWMDSPGHRANMLNTKYQDIGVSVKRGIYEGKDVWFAVQHFGTSRSICPKIDTSLKSDIDATNQYLKNEEAVIARMKKNLEAPGAQNDPLYKESVARFNESVDAYNNILATSREKIHTYNEEVRSFNKCITTFQ